MEHVRVIRKYPNRRLYDTQESCYVALRDVCSLVQDGAAIQVLDNRTQQDITLNILLQIIIDQEQKNQVLSVALLNSLIRSYKEPQRELIGGYLEKSLQLLERYKQQPSKNPLNKQALSKLTRLQENALQSLLSR